MDAVDSLFRTIDNGRSGLNIGLDIGLPKLQEITSGVQRQTYSVVAGKTGSGKSTFVLYSYVYRVIHDHLGDMRYRIIYLSFEMTAEVILAKMLSMYLWEHKMIEIPYEQIMSRNSIISDDLYSMLEESKPWLRQVLKQLVIIDRAISADAIYANLKTYAQRNGIETIGENGKIHYKPYVENELVQVVVDHLAIIKVGNRTKKEEMDLAANYLLSIRNIYAYSPMVIMQVNRTSASMDRRKANMSELELNDIKDTGTAAEAAEIVIALFSPWKDKLTTHKGYNIQILKDNYRAIQILKNRLGQSDKQVSVAFHGAVGIFQELLPAEELNRLSDTQMENSVRLTPRTDAEVTFQESAPIKREGEFTFKL